jgi:hypothetical protein
MPDQEKEEMKSIKVAASTHSRLILLSDVFGNTVSEVIDSLIGSTYPEVIEEASKLQEHKEALREQLLSKQKPNRK